MLGQLRTPSPGFEEVMRTHFYLKLVFDANTAWMRVSVYACVCMCEKLLMCCSAISWFDCKLICNITEVHTYANFRSTGISQEAMRSVAGRGEGLECYCTLRAFVEIGEGIQGRAREAASPEECLMVWESEADVVRRSLGEKYIKIVVVCVYFKLRVLSVGEGVRSRTRVRSTYKWWCAKGRILLGTVKYFRELDSWRELLWVTKRAISEEHFLLL